MKIDYISFSEKGIRSSNQDYIKIVEQPRYNRNLFVLCDGMGGHPMGDLASRTVAESITEFWNTHKEENDSIDKVQTAIKETTIHYDEISDKMNNVQMGTTLVMCSIENNIATIAHIGDSRCYLLRNNSNNVIYQTQDHIELQYGSDMVFKCFFSYKPDVAVPDIKQFEIIPGDVIFLCSDGVYKFIRPDIMRARLLDDDKLENISDVIQFLCEKYSKDNYSGIIIKIKK